MIIKADREGRAVLTGMADYARKVCPLQEVGIILKVISSIQEIEDDKTIQGECRTDTTTGNEMEEGKPSSGNGD